MVNLIPNRTRLLLNRLFRRHRSRLFQEESIAKALPDEVKDKILTHGKEYLFNVETIKLQRKMILKTALLEKDGFFGEYDARSLDFMLEYMSGEDEKIIAMVGEFYNKSV